VRSSVRRDIWCRLFEYGARKLLAAKAEKLVAENSAQKSEALARMVDRLSEVYVERMPPIEEEK
jgi:hypothetical protein